MGTDRFDFSIWDPENEDIIGRFIDVLKAAHSKPLVADKEIFLWKHKANPAGPSLLAYAVDRETGQLAAMQVFSPRRIVYNGRSYPGYESNDTSTHPSYGRQGLFSGLLKLCMDTADARKGICAYGFPNVNSRRGFEKAGWRNVGGIKMAVKICSPLKVGYSFLRGRKRTGLFAARPKAPASCGSSGARLPERTDELLLLRNGWSDTRSGWRSRDFLEWRFLRHPYYDYEIINTDDGVAFVLIGKRDILREVRITDVFFDGGFSGNSVKKLVGSIRGKFYPDIITMVLSDAHPYHDAFCGAGFYKAPSDIMLFDYVFGCCPPELSCRPWAIMGADLDTQ